MISIRLDQKLEQKLIQFSTIHHQTKTDTIKNALAHYFNTFAPETTPSAYELGENLFGKYGSQEGTLSSTYKQKLKDKINAKNHH
ncbi:MAG: CopG family transcriptional regulator [Sulfurovum sp.]|nr:MAG: CopG family transcriptional regulator [Sulfurovum sp.]